MEKGGKEYVLLHNRIRTGLYIVWCKVASRMTTDDSPFEDHHPWESHAFVYDSNYNKFEDVECYGAIIDNREHSYLRAFEKEDIKDKLSVRKTLENYFLGETRICGWKQIIVLK